MGAGASAVGLRASVQLASQSDLIESLRGLTSAERARLYTALEGFPHPQQAPISPKAGVVTAEMFAGGHPELRVPMANEFEFAKTQVEDERFEHELAFLRFAKDSDLWRDLVPKLIRVEEIGERPFVVLENVMGGMEHPVIADFKLGTQSWAPGANPEKIAKMEERDAVSATPSLGIRVTSAMLPQGKDPEAGYLSSGRVAVKKGLEESSWRAAQTEEDVCQIMAAFLFNEALREAFREKLQPFIRVFQEQTEYSFFGSSLLTCYDHCIGPTSLSMRLIDFGHAQNGQSGTDEGVLKGLMSLDKIVGGLPPVSDQTAPASIDGAS